LTLDEVFGACFTGPNLSVFRGAQFDHIRKKWTLPIGLPVEMDAQTGTLRFLQPTVV
jgi:muramoyltetrapeptide carboxypeptidase